MFSLPVSLQSVDTNGSILGHIGVEDLCEEESLQVHKKPHHFLGVLHGEVLVTTSNGTKEILYLLFRNNDIIIIKLP